MVPEDFIFLSFPSLVFITWFIFYKRGTLPKILIFPNKNESEGIPIQNMSVGFPTSWKMPVYHFSKKLTEIYIQKFHKA